MNLIWPDDALRAQLPDCVRLCVSTRLSGHTVAPFGRGNLALHVGDDAVRVASNRRQLLQQLPGAQAIQWLQQVHGTDCSVAAGGAVTPICDSVFTRETGLACAVLTADCLPILLMSDDGAEIAAVHAGWRGLAAGALDVAVGRFSPSSRLKAVIGPAIGFEAFEVGEEVVEAFYWADSECFQALGANKYLANLNAIAQLKLAQMAVECIGDLSYCTASRNDLFYSYRKEGQTGRMASLIWRAR